MRRSSQMFVCFLLWPAAGCVVPWVGEDDSLTDDTVTDQGDTDVADTDGGGGGGRKPRSGAKPADNCASAKGFGTLKEGTFNGSLENYTLSGLVPLCGGGFLPPDTQDAFYRIDLEPKQKVTVEFVFATEDVVMYLVKGCAPTSDCVTYQDVGREGVADVLDWSNGSATATATYYLGVGTYKASTLAPSFTITTTYDP